MKKILVVGNAPLPNENVKFRPAAGLRTYQFFKPLLELDVELDGFKIGIVTIAMPECYDEEVKMEVKNFEGCEQFVISKNHPGLVSEIQKFFNGFSPDIIVAVNTYPSFVASKIKAQVPFWADLNGWIMAEAQAQAYKIDSNEYLSHYFGMEKEILRRADKISVVSERQKYAVLGELAGMGRLNKETFGYNFCEHISNAIEQFESEVSGVETSGIAAHGVETSGIAASGVEASGIAAHGVETSVDNDSFDLGLPDKAFVVLWIGGYNTWVDEVTLFKALEKAMQQCANLFFVSTGGEIKGLDNKTFKTFKTLVDGCEYKDRFKFLGWIKTADIPLLYKKAQIGINVDRECVETLTGARNRINEMMKFGLPVVTTLGSEISYEVDGVGAGMAVKSGDYKGLAEAITLLYSQHSQPGEKLKDYGEKSRKYIEENCNYQKIMAPLLKWLGNPLPAPDREIKIVLDAGLSWKAIWRYLKENGFRKSFKKFLQKIKG